MNTTAETCCKRRLPAKRLSAVAVGEAIAWFLLPKCPLCVAAQLSVLGVSAGVSYALTPLLWPLCLAAGVIAVALLFYLPRRI